MRAAIKVEVGSSTTKKNKDEQKCILKSMLPTPGASISIVSELVDMEAMEAISQTSELTSHLHWPTGDKNIFKPEANHQEY